MSPRTPRSKSPSRTPPIKIKKTTESIISQLRKREIGMLPRKRINFSQYKKFNDTELYSIDVLYHLTDILKYNKQIELYKYNIDDNDDVKLTKYNNLCLYTDIRAQNTIHSYYDSSGVFNEITHTFDLNGINIDDKNDGARLLNDILIEHLYVDKKFTTLYLFNYTYYYENNNTFQQKISKEEKIFGNFIKYYNVKLIKNKSDDEFDDPKFKFFDELDKKIKEEGYKYNDTECNIENSNSNNMSYGGNNAKAKYIKSLKNKTLEKLQNIAKNKKIKYTKKLNGKTTPIKRETLINKLCKYKFQK
jgi:hypothetical protein